MRLEPISPRDGEVHRHMPMPTFNTARGSPGAFDSISILQLGIGTLSNDAPACSAALQSTLPQVEVFQLPPEALLLRAAGALLL